MGEERGRFADDQPHGSLAVAERGLADAEAGPR
jgi:hypothetical protein